MAEQIISETDCDTTPSLDTAPEASSEDYLYRVNVIELDTNLQPEIGRDLCRVKREEGKYGGYRRDALTENLTEREKDVLICKFCEEIMKEACISKLHGDQFCSCCRKCSSEEEETPDVSVRKMINSLKCSCPLLSRGCTWLGTLGNCEDHLDKCGYVYESCKLECGVVLGRGELEMHEKEKCPQRKVECNHCMREFKSCELTEHLERCPKMKVLCDLCDIQITREEIEKHLKYDCGMVREVCGLGCGVTLTRNKLVFHVKDACIQREIHCEHCEECVKYCDMSTHLDECPNVTVACDLCGIEKYRKDIPLHVKDHCLENEIECIFVKYKCLERMKRKHLDKHVEEKQGKHLGLTLTAIEDLISSQTKELDKVNESVEKQNKQINKQNEIIEQHSKEINKQNEIIDQHRKEINKLNEVVKYQNEEIDKMRTEKTITSQRIKLLYSITDTTIITWKIDVTNPIRIYGLYRSSESKQYEMAGCRFGFKFRFQKRQLLIVFPATPWNRCDNPFIAKCNIIFTNYTIDCGKVEVNQKDLARGCERTITSFSEEDIKKYSEPNNPSGLGKTLTLEIIFTMQ